MPLSTRDGFGVIIGMLEELLLNIVDIMELI